MNYLAFGSPLNYRNKLRRAKGTVAECTGSGKRFDEQTTFQGYPGKRSECWDEDERPGPIPHALD